MAGRGISSLGQAKGAEKVEVWAIQSLKKQIIQIGFKDQAVIPES